MRSKTFGLTGLLCVWLASSVRFALLLNVGYKNKSNEIFDVRLEQTSLLTSDWLTRSPHVGKGLVFLCSHLASF